MTSLWLRGVAGWYPVNTAFLRALPVAASQSGPVAQVDRAAVS